MNQNKKSQKRAHCTGLREILESPAAQQMAQRARTTAGVGDRLYHGTRYVASVLAAMELRYSRIGDRAIFLTRSPQVAAYWALIERDDDEGRGGILILDKTSLRRRYKIEPHHDPFWDHDPARIDEMTEAIFGRNILDLSRHLIGVVREPILRGSGRCDYGRAVVLRHDAAWARMPQAMPQRLTGVGVSRERGVKQVGQAHAG